MKNSIIVLLEFDGDKLDRISLELLSEGFKLASQLQIPLEAVALGNGIKPALDELGHYGCSRVFYVEDEALRTFRALPFAKAMIHIIQKYKPQIVLFGGTANGRAIAPRIASALKCGLTADCTALQIGDFSFEEKEYHNKLLQIRPAFGGNIIATIVSPESFPTMATVRKGVMPVSKGTEHQKVEVVREQIPFDPGVLLTEVLDQIHQEKAVDLLSSQIVVSAGMGVENSGTLSLVRKLADVLGGVVGASRAMVDSGQLVKDHQVGQTGTTVRPALYIACGISGQIQHRAGMAESKRIIAINRDPDAPIFKIAHYGIVGDLNKVLPMMIKAYQEKK